MRATGEGSAPEGRIVGGGVGQVGGKSLKPHLFQRVGSSGRGDDLVSGLSEREGDMAADEAVGAEDQNLHCLPSTLPATASSLAVTSGSRLPGAVMMA